MSTLPQQERARAETKLRRLFRRFGMKTRAHVVVRLPFTRRVTKAAVAKAVRTLVEAGKGSATFKWHAKTNVKVVWQKRRTVADVLYNHRRFARELRANAAPQCVCASFPGLPRINGHVCCRGSDAMHLAPAVLDCNVNDSLAPAYDTTEADVMAALEAAVKDLSGCLDMTDICREWLKNLCVTVCRSGDTAVNDDRTGTAHEPDNGHTQRVRGVPAVNSVKTARTRARQRRHTPHCSKGS